MRLFPAVLVTLFLLCAFGARGDEVLQILHTNDVHSYFDHAHHEPNRGGYGRIKTLIEKLKKEASDKGIKTLVVDGGDFTEGNLYYMADEGVRSFEMYDLIGYDVAVVGNHDYLMGTDKFDDAIARSYPKVRYVGANINVESRFKHLKEKLEDAAVIDYNGFKLAVLGLTTNEVVFRWRLYDGGVSDPIKSAIWHEQKLKLAGADGIIALTHIGLSRDRKLVDKTRHIDLVIGGHSHDALFKPEWATNNNKHLVPIVQAGEHGRYVGRLMVKLKKGEGVRLLSSELVPVEGMEKDPVIEDQISLANTDLNSLYGPTWLSQVVGQSALEPLSKSNESLWALFVTDAMRDAARTEIAIHTSSMTGPNYPINGPVTRRDLLNAHPRFFDFNDYRGWYVYRAKIYGVLVKQVIKTVVKHGLGLSFSGITFRIEKDLKGDIDIKDMMIGGKKVKPFEVYSMAMPEGVARGGANITSLVSWVFKSMHRTPYTVLNALERRFQLFPVLKEDYVARAFDDESGLKSKGSTKTIFNHTVVNPQTLETSFY
ncbi:MAG: hypothetical protein CME71_07995 [Halobacteriovorax sp.]|nr:hypothetical protein [Halobacteriovorax sp.]